MLLERGRIRHFEYHSTSFTLPFSFDIIKNLAEKYNLMPMLIP